MGAVAPAAPVVHVASGALVSPSAPDAADCTGAVDHTRVAGHTGVADHYHVADRTFVADGAHNFVDDTLDVDHAASAGGIAAADDAPDVADVADADTAGGVAGVVAGADGAPGTVGARDVLDAAAGVDSAAVAYDLPGTPDHVDVDHDIGYVHGDVAAADDTVAVDIAAVAVAVADPADMAGTACTASPGAAPKDQASPGSARHQTHKTRLGQDVGGQVRVGPSRRRSADGSLQKASAINTPALASSNWHLLARLMFEN